MKERPREPQTPPLLVSLREAMRLLSLGRDKVRSEFKPVITGKNKRQYRYKMRDIEAWIERRSLR